MLSKEEFIAILDEEIGFSISMEDLKVGLDSLADWDSIMLLRLQLILERKLRRRIALPKLLEARTIEAIFEAVSEHG